MYLLLEKVIGCSQMPVDCLRALKLVTLGYLSMFNLHEYLHPGVPYYR